MLTNKKFKDVFQNNLAILQQQSPNKGLYIISVCLYQLDFLCSSSCFPKFKVSKYWGWSEYNLSDI